MAVCLAWVAAGFWSGSVCLTTVEAVTIQTVKDERLATSSRDRVRTCVRTVKYTRELPAAGTDAWHAPVAPSPLHMPFQGLLSRPALAKVDKLAEGGHAGAKQLATYYVGQGGGLMDAQQTTRQVMYAFMEDYAAEIGRAHV